MNIKILMMFKNEDELIRPWIAYHADMVGAENLVIFDNGSTSQKTLDEVRRAQNDYNVTVDMTQATTQDWIAKGELFKHVIKRFDRTDPADFYFPLDCDEFLAVNVEGTARTGPEFIHAELAQYRNSPDPLRIFAGLDNNPFIAGHFKWAQGQKKTFFAQDACTYLDHGFHSGATASGNEAIRTNIVYFHYHYKPYRVFLDHSKEKLRPFLPDFSTETLRAYLSEKRSGYHNAQHLLTSEEDYAKMFPAQNYKAAPDLEIALSRLGFALPYSSQAQGA